MLLRVITGLLVFVSFGLLVLILAVCLSVVGP